MKDDSETDFHIAIIGAGIGGLALAMALHRKKIPFTVYEEAKQYSAVGAGIGFGPNGLQAMDIIEEDFRPRYEAICVGNKSAEAQHVFFEGMLLEEGLGVGERWYGRSSWGHPDYTRRSAHRKQLLDVMTSFIPIETVRFSKHLTDIQQQPDRVMLRFADDETVETSIVVGGDGISSIVREHVLRTLFPSQIRPVYADSYCYRGVIPIAEAVDILGDLTDVAKIYMGDKRCCVTYRISGGKEYNFLLCVFDTKPWPSETAVTQKVLYEEMMNDFENRGFDSRFIRLLSKAEPIRWGLFHHKFTSTYYRGRVVLIGDSAHASLPFQAGGASQGLEDAVILSDLLARVTNAARKDGEDEHYIHAAFDGYDSVRRPRAEKQLVKAAEVSDMIYFQHRETGSDMNKILNNLQTGWFDWLWFHDLRADLNSASQRMDEILDKRVHARLRG